MARGALAKKKLFKKIRAKHGRVKISRDNVKK